MPAYQITPTIYHSTATMARRNFSSWFSSSSSSSRDEAETKKLNRRSFAGFSTASHPFSKSKLGTTTITNDMLPTVLLAKKERPSTSSTTDASEVVVVPPAVPDNTGLKQEEKKAAEEEEGEEVSSTTMSMTALADKISKETAKLETYLKENGLPMPDFGVDAADDFPRLPDEMQKSRLEIIHATKLLRDLAVGPREGVRWGVQQVSIFHKKPSFLIPLVKSEMRENRCVDKI